MMILGMRMLGITVVGIGMIDRHFGIIYTLIKVNVIVKLWVMMEFKLEKKKAYMLKKKIIIIINKDMIDRHFRIFFFFFYLPQM